MGEGGLFCPCHFVPQNGKVVPWPTKNFPDKSCLPPSVRCHPPRISPPGWGKRKPEDAGPWMLEATGPSCDPGMRSDLRQRSFESVWMQWLTGWFVAGAERPANSANRRERGLT